MKTSFQYLSFLLSISLLAACNGVGFKRNCDDDEIVFKKAARNNDTEMMQLLLDTKNININASCGEANCTNGHDVALIDAAHYNSLGAVIWLLERKELDINAKNQATYAWVTQMEIHHRKGGDTALIVAARYGHITLVEKLIERRANLNLKNNEGQTALMVAIAEGHEAVALTLIAEKARGRINLDLKDNDGWSALKYARKGKRKNTRIVEALLDNGAKEYDPVKIVKKGVFALFKKTAQEAPERIIELAPYAATL